jgi:hypothetical protein
MDYTKVQCENMMIYGRYLGKMMEKWWKWVCKVKVKTLGEHPTMQTQTTKNKTWTHHATTKSKLWLEHHKQREWWDRLFNNNQPRTRTSNKIKDTWYATKTTSPNGTNITNPSNMLKSVKGHDKLIVPNHPQWLLPCPWLAKVG